MLVCDSVFLMGSEEKQNALYHAYDKFTTLPGEGVAGPERRGVKAV